MNPWPLARGTYEGLSICLGEDDWYVLAFRGTAALRISVIHSTDVDLDVQVFRDGLLIGEGSDDGTISTVQIPAALSGDLVVRVYAVRGVNAPYLLVIGDAIGGCMEEASEPNDLREEAAALRSGTAAVFSTCPRNVDFIAFTEGMGAATLTLVPIGEFDGSWQTDLAWDEAPFQALSANERGERKLDFAWFDTAGGPVLRATSNRAVRWNIEFESFPASCEDVTRGNRDALTSLPLELGTTQSVLCPDGSEFETDWFIPQLPEGVPVELRAHLRSLDDSTIAAAPPLALAIATGPDARPWRTAQPSEAGLSAVAQISQIDRPVYLTVRSTAAIPALLENWPGYELEVTATALEVCVQDRGELLGNDSFDQATPVAGTATGLLCPQDVDFFATDTSLTRAEATAPVLLRLFDENQVEIADFTIGAESMAFDPVETADGRFVAISALESLPAQGAIYEIAVADP
jgi:hypothetical protein